MASPHPTKRQTTAKRKPAKPAPAWKPAAQTSPARRYPIETGDVLGFYVQFTATSSHVRGGDNRLATVLGQSGYSNVRVESVVGESSNWFSGNYSTRGLATSPSTHARLEDVHGIFESAVKRAYGGRVLSTSVRVGPKDAQSYADSGRTSGQPAQSGGKVIDARGNTEANPKFNAPSPSETRTLGDSFKPIAQGGVETYLQTLGITGPIALVAGLLILVVALKK